ncbi:hypothetical protein CAEBREN_23340 [Caenorhabditis brenneri]|uniref:Uncharacterized protein n=1 Tax=Caenorhabditis brenneri TaxID=135651 RepID=G0NH94_CAEBE|nr:hypothetical protein CAEBREN_23340 [Caenorhabditis brenneri]
MKLFVLFLFFYSALAEFQFELKNNTNGAKSLIEAMEAIDGNRNKSEYRRKSSEFELEPPDTYTRIVNLFYGKMFYLLEKNMQDDIDTIAKYTNQDTAILLCEDQKRSTFAELRRFIGLLHKYFREVKQDGLSMQPKDEQKRVEFQMRYKAKTVENTEVIITWHGDAKYDENLHYFLYTKLSLTGDCTKVPDEIPDHPVQPIQNYWNRIESNLTSLIFPGPGVKTDTYQLFIKRFLLDRTRVQFCERGGEVMDGSKHFKSYLETRYASVESFLEHSFRTEPFSSYQTDGVYTVTVTWKNGVIMKDIYRFRVEEAREKGGDQGWKDWWATWAIVECPVDLTPRTDPEGQKKVFIQQVCGSIPPMITNGPSVSSRATFISHFMQREDQGFHAQICTVNDNKPIYKFSLFEKWLSAFSTDYDYAKLYESKVESYQNFEFICVVDIMQDYGPGDQPWRRIEFKMKAYFEIDKWLVKETKIGCVTNPNNGM